MNTGGAHQLYGFLWKLVVLEDPTFFCLGLGGGGGGGGGLSFQYLCSTWYFPHEGMMD